jgi:hypothetical protein
MVYVPAQNVAQANLRYTWDNQLCENTLYFELTTATIDKTLLEILALDLATWWSNNIAARQTVGIALREVYCVDLTTQTGPTGAHVPNPPTPGGSVSPSLPNNVALCVSFRTGGRGRSSRGRNYVPGLTEADVTNNEVDTLAASAIASAYELLMVSSTFTSPWNWVVISRYENKAPRLSALVQPVTDVVITDNIVDSQRKRLPKRGR